VHREVGDRVAASVELFNLGEILRQLQQYQEALRCLEEARQILSALEDPLGLALCYYNMGNVYRDLGEYGTALRYYQETLASRLRIPHDTSTLWCAPFMGIAMIQSQLGDHREALKYYREALAISQRLGDHRDMVATSNPLRPRMRSSERSLMPSPIISRPSNSGEGFATGKGRDGASITWAAHMQRCGRSRRPDASRSRPSTWPMRSAMRSCRWAQSSIWQRFIATWEGGKPPRPALYLY
jgi:tetratricopeptide (TPR) repeat protein